VAQRIRDLCWRWLEPEHRTSVQVAEAVALEQLLQALPTGGKEWVQRHRPKTLAEATALMEDYLAVEGEPKASSKGGNLGERNLIPVQGVCKVEGGSPRPSAQPSGTPPTRSAREPQGATPMRSQDNSSGRQHIPLNTPPHRRKSGAVLRVRTDRVFPEGMSIHGL
ncbi:zinc finger protein 197, partial [Chelydra serpentina]